MNTYKNLFVTSSEWLWNAFERHSIAGDNHSKTAWEKLCKASGARFNPEAAGGWLSIQLKERRPSGHGVFFQNRLSPLWSWCERACTYCRWTNVVYRIKDQSSFSVLTAYKCTPPELKITTIVVCLHKGWIFASSLLFKTGPNQTTQRIVKSTLLIVLFSGINKGWMKSYLSYHTANVAVRWTEDVSTIVTLDTLLHS